QSRRASPGKLTLQDDEVIHGDHSSMVEPDDKRDDAGRSWGLEDFIAHRPSHKYVNRATGEPWAPQSINAIIPPVPTAGGKSIDATVWLDQNAGVDQMTWAPGEPEIIEGRLVKDAGWADWPGARVFNLYRPPSIVPKAGNVTPWLDHLKAVYPDDWGH